MPQKLLYADRSSLLARSDTGLNLGGGKDAHLPIINNPGGYNLRGVIGFTFPAGFWSDMRRITSVRLRLNGTSATAHVAKGASRSALCYRAISAWSQNTAAESWTTSPVVYPGPSITTAGGVTLAMPGNGVSADNTITTMAMAWAPNSVVGPTGTPGGGAVMYGIALHETGGAPQAAEVHSAVVGTQSLRPLLIFDYESNAPPDAPTLIRPVGPDQVAGTFEAQGRDPEADALTAYDIQVSTDPTFATVTHWNGANQTTGLDAAGHLQRVYAGTAMTNGTRYYWRTRQKDAGSGAFGPWSSVGTFVKAAAGGPPEDLYDYWMTAILQDMAFGRTAVRLGTLRPINEQVALLVCAEYGDLFTLAWDETSPPINEGVYLLGEKVSLSPDGWAVDAIVELEREVG